MTILLVRHALAVARKNWEGDDLDRPLTARGLRQADALVEQLRDYDIDRIRSSPSVRCSATVAPLASERGLPVERAVELAEGGGAAGVSLVERQGGIVLCAHGDNLPELLVALAGHLPEVPPDPPFAKGATWALTRDGTGKVRHAVYLEPPA